MNKQKVSFFSRFSRWIANASGKPITFNIAVLVIIVWGLTGPIFGFSDTWQLVINTGTTIITFLMVFLIQSTQNRDTEAIQLKLDELIRVTKNARNEIIELEDLDESELSRIRKEYIEIAEKAERKLASEKKKKTKNNFFNKKR